MSGKLACTVKNLIIEPTVDDIQISAVIFGQFGLIGSVAAYFPNAFASVRRYRNGIDKSLGFGEWRNNRLTNINSEGIIKSGGEQMSITGANGAIPRSDIERQETHAKLYYDEIRKRSDDIEVIAKKQRVFD